MDKVELVTHALRDALMTYQNLDGPDAALVIVALFRCHALEARCAVARRPCAQRAAGAKNATLIALNRSATRAAEQPGVVSAPLSPGSAVWERAARLPAVAD